MGEIDLRGEEGRRFDAIVAFLRHQRQGCRQKRAADAIADGVDLLFAGRFFDRVEPVLQALANIGFPILGAVALIRIDPGDDEDGVALFDRPADEGFLRVEIEDVELVDPGRADQQAAA